MSHDWKDQVFHGVHAAHRFLHTDAGKKTAAVLTTAAVAAAPVLLPALAVGGLGYAAWRFFGGGKPS